MLIPVTHRVIIKQEKLEEIDPTYIKMKALGFERASHEDTTRAQAGVDKGKIVSFGPTAFRDFETDVPFKVGDLVAFAKYSGKTVTDPDDGLEYVCLNDEDIVCLIKETK